MEEQYKKFKSNYYNFLTSLEENNQSLKNYTDTQPKDMLKSNDNFMHSLKTIEKGGTYSQREVEFTKNELDVINNDIIIKNKEERDKKEVVQRKTNPNLLLEEIDLSCNNLGYSGIETLSNALLII